VVKKRKSGTGKKVGGARYGGVRNVGREEGKTASVWEGIGSKGLGQEEEGKGSG